MLVEKRIGAMTTYFDDAMVRGYESLIPSMTNDAKDRHVLAATVLAKARMLVTFNLKDFPSDSVRDFDISVVHPDDFLLDRLAFNPSLVLNVLTELISSYRKPALTLDGYLSSLSRAGVPIFSDMVRFRFRRGF